MNDAKAAFLASRPFSWVNTAFPFAAGWLVSGMAVDWRFWVGTFFFLFPYNLAMYGINDIFDYESDLLNPRKASIEGALLEPSRFKALWIWIGVATVPLAAVLFAAGNGVAAAWLAFSLFMVAAYSAKPLRFKEIPFLDSFTSACHFVTPLVYALALTRVFPAGTWPVCVAFFLWGMASHAFGAVQDVPYDREGGIASVATVFGARPTVIGATLLYAGSAGLIAVFFPTTLGIAAAAGVAFYAVNAGRFWKTTDATAPETNRGWRLFLGLNAGLGAFLTNAYIYDLGHEPIWVPFVAALVVYVGFFSFLRKKA
jgi:lycopene elongase/hydratase (flavuxanthin-forming)